MNRNKKLLKNIIALMFGSVMTKGINFIMAPLFIRWLSPTEYGTFDLLCTYVTLLIPIFAFGTHHAVFRFLLDARTEDIKESIVTNTLFLNVIGFFMYSACIIFIYIIKPTMQNYAINLSILLFTQLLQNYMGMYIRGIKRLKLYSLINVLCTTFILIFVTLFVRFFFKGLNGIILGYSVGYFLSMLIGAIKCQICKYIKFTRISFKEQKKILHYSIPMIPNSIAWWVVNISDRMIVALTLGMTANAILAISHKIPNLCTTIYDIFQTAWLENAAESIKDLDWKEYFEKSLNIMSKFCISVSIMIITSNFFLYDFLFIKNYYKGKFLVPIFAVAVIFASLSQMLGSVFIAEYDSKIQGVSMLEAGIVNIIFDIFLIKYVGIYAPAVSTLVAYAYLFFIRLKKINMKYNIHFDKKNIILSSLTVIYIILAYLNISIVNYISFITSIFIVVLFNKEILQGIIKKLKVWFI